MSSHDGVRSQAAKGLEPQESDDTLMANSSQQQQYEHFHQLRIQPRQPVYHPHRRHAPVSRYHNPNDYYHKQKRRHESGDKVLNQLMNDLAKSTLEDYDKPDSAYYKGEDGGRKSRRLAREAKRESQAQTPDSKPMTKKQRQKEKQKQRASKGKKSKAKDSSSKDEILPLGFDDQYLRRADTGMNNNQIRKWINSVFPQHIENWYRDCLSLPENEPQFKAAQVDPDSFANSVLLETLTYNDFSDVLASDLTQLTKGPAGLHLGMRPGVSLNFIQHTAVVAHLIIHGGMRGGNFAKCKDPRKLHKAAVMLLVTVIMDLKVGFGYFFRHLNRAATKTLQVPKALLSVTVDAFGELQRTSGCAVTVHQGQLADLAYNVDLTGTAGQVDEAEQVILKLMESTTVSERLSELASRVADCKMED